MCWLPRYLVPTGASEHKMAVASLLPPKSHLEPYREGNSGKLGFIVVELTSSKVTRHTPCFQKCFKALHRIMQESGTQSRLKAIF